MMQESAPELSNALAQLTDLTPSEVIVVEDTTVCRRPVVVMAFDSVPFSADDLTTNPPAVTGSLQEGVPAGWSQVLYAVAALGSRDVTHDKSRRMPMRSRTGMTTPTMFGPT